MPPGGSTEDENVEPGGFEAISRWSSPPVAEDTTGGLKILIAMSAGLALISPTVHHPGGIF